MKLRNIQEHFRSYVTSDNIPIAADFADTLRVDGISLENRLSVYHNNVIKSLRDNIIATYPLIEKLVGHDFLKAMARLYVLQNLPQEANLNLYGDNFAALINSFEPAKDLPYLPDMARFEWLMNESYFAPDDKALRPEAYTPEELENATLHLRHSSKLLSSPFPLDKIRALCLGQETNTINIEQKPSYLIIYRPNIDVAITTVKKEEFYFISCFQENDTISNAAETILNIYPNIDLTAILQRLFKNRILTTTK